MVHMLASHLHSEFLAVPQLIRFDMPRGQDGPEPTLLIKANSLSLKYLLRSRSFRLIVTKIGQKIAYAVEIHDDPKSPALIWSLIQLPNEVAALAALITKPKCIVFLFNELAVSVAWTEISIQIDSSVIKDPIDFHTPTDQDEAVVGDRLDEVQTQDTVSETQVFSFIAIEWHEIHAIYITNRIGSSSLSLFNNDEGGQQEEIAVWLTDSLQPEGCVKSPKVREKIEREFCDILFSYELGTFMIESKSLSILTRNNLPDRKKLTGDLSKHIVKAAKQLIGGVRNLKKDLFITDGSGVVLDIERRIPVQAIILVPDLALLQDSKEFGANFFLQFEKETGGYLHILDPAELLRVVQAAEMIAENSESVTKMMAFDYYLLRRAEISVKHQTPNFAVLFRKGPQN